MIKILRAKIHGVHVTGCDLDYHGSITLDPDQCAEAGIVPMEFVNIWNKNNGARISTYVIYGEPGSRCCVLNGAAARVCQKGDALIISAEEYINNPAELPGHSPLVLEMGEDNSIVARYRYEVSSTPSGRMDFAVKKIWGPA